MKEHVHKYKRVIMGGKKFEKDENGKLRIVRQAGYPVYKCVVPGCTHYVPRELAEGRESTCWRCGERLTMTTRNLTQAKPTHRECTRGANKDPLS